MLLIANITSACKVKVNLYENENPTEMTHRNHKLELHLTKNWIMQSS